MQQGRACMYLIRKCIWNAEKYMVKHYQHYWGVSRCNYCLDWNILFIPSCISFYSWFFTGCYSSAHLLKEEQLSVCQTNWPGIKTSQSVPPALTLLCSVAQLHYLLLNYPSLKIATVILTYLKGCFKIYISNVYKNTEIFSWEVLSKCKALFL